MYARLRCLFLDQSDMNGRTDDADLSGLERINWCVDEHHRAVQPPSTVTILPTM